MLFPDRSRGQALSDSQWQSPRNSPAIPAALPFPIEQIQPKSER